MKTNKFENTIRRKLESIQPDFQEQDWAKMQQYMQVHNPPGFWQQYGSWVGYAAAASVSAVMGFLYINQLSQNDHLVSDVKNLKSQIELIQNQPAPVAKTDTIYLVQKESFSGEHNTIAQVREEETSYNIGVDRKEELAELGQPANDKQTEPVSLPGNSVERKLGLSLGNNNVEPRIDNAVTDNTRPASNNNIQYSPREVLEPGGSAPSVNQSGLAVVSGQRALGGEYMVMNTKSGIELHNGVSLSRQMNYTLASRLSSKQVQRALSPVVPQPITNVSRTQIAAAPASEKKVEKTTKTENVIPKLNLKVPYRFGAGIVMEGNGQAKTVVGEVLLAKKFSITAGINWLKVKPMEFFTEKIFREKNRQDFKKAHPGEVPLAFNVYNIKVNPTMVQIPLTVAFRNNIKDNWAYYAGVGTNITVSSKENISFDCKAPNNEFFSQAFDKKTDIPAISSVNFSMGLEKTWHPIVIQAEGYLYTYFTPLTPMSHSAGPGLKVKILYQIGGKM